MKVTKGKRKVEKEKNVRWKKERQTEKGKINWRKKERQIE